MYVNVQLLYACTCFFLSSGRPVLRYLLSEVVRSCFLFSVFFFIFIFLFFERRGKGERGGVCDKILIASVPPFFSYIFYTYNYYSLICNI